MIFYSLIRCYLGLRCLEIAFKNRPREKIIKAMMRNCRRKLKSSMDTLFDSELIV